MNSASTVVTTNNISVYSDSELSEVTYETYPFKTEDNDTDAYPKLLAYRFRAYESVYNAYYRDIRNNPFVVDGRPVYNKWLPTMKGGADTTLYELHQCNWERDFLTTADAFIGSRDFIVHILDDGSYDNDYPVVITKSKDGVVGAIISSVDVGDLDNIQGGLRLVLSGMSTAASIEFTGMSFNALLDYYQLQSDVSYTKYPFGVGHICTVSDKLSEWLLPFFANRLPVAVSGASGCSVS